MSHGDQGPQPPLTVKKMNHRPKLRPIFKHLTFTGDSPEFVHATLTHGKNVPEEGESEIVLSVFH